MMVDARVRDCVLQIAGDPFVTFLSLAAQRVRERRNCRYLLAQSLTFQSVATLWDSDDILPYILNATGEFYAAVVLLRNVRTGM